MWVSSDSLIGRTLWPLTCTDDLTGRTISAVQMQHLDKQSAKTYIHAHTYTHAHLKYHNNNDKIQYRGDFTRGMRVCGTFHQWQYELNRLHKHTHTQAHTHTYIHTNKQGLLHQSRLSLIETHSRCRRCSFFFLLFSFFFCLKSHAEGKCSFDSSQCYIYICAAMTSYHNQDSRCEC